MEDLLKIVSQDLDKHSKKSHDTLLSYYVELRINKSLESYYQDILSSYNCLSRRNELNVLKKLNKEDKF